MVVWRGRGRWTKSTVQNRGKEVAGGGAGGGGGGLTFQFSCLLYPPLQHQHRLLQARRVQGFRSWRSEEASCRRGGERKEGRAGRGEGEDGVLVMFRV